MATWILVMILVLVLLYVLRRIKVSRRRKAPRYHRPLPSKTSNVCRKEVCRSVVAKKPSKKRLGERFSLDPKRKGMYERANRTFKRIEEGKKFAKEHWKKVKDDVKKSLMGPEEEKAQAESLKKMYEKFAKREVEMQKWKEQFNRDRATRYKRQNLRKFMLNTSRFTKFDTYIEASKAPKAHLDQVLSKGRNLLRVLIQRRQEMEDWQAKADEGAVVAHGTSGFTIRGLDFRDPDVREVLEEEVQGLFDDILYHMRLFVRPRLYFPHMYTRDCFADEIPTAATLAKEAKRRKRKRKLPPAAELTRSTAFPTRQKLKTLIEEPPTHDDDVVKSKC